MFLSLKTHEDIYVKMKHKLNALFDLVQSLGNEFQSLKTEVQLKCHSNSKLVYAVTSFVYNESTVGWKKVKAHIKVIWYDSHKALDLAKLYEGIMEIKRLNYILM